MHMIGQLRDRLDQIEHTFLLDHTAEVADMERARRERRAWRMEQLVVDAKLRKDMQGTTVAMAPEDVRRFMARGEAGVCLIEVVALEMAEWRRVAPVDVGPVIKAAFGPVLHAKLHRLEGRKIERFFVDMKNIGLDQFDQALESRVKVEMKMAVQPHG